MKKKGEAFWVKQPATEALRGGSPVCSRNQKQPLVTGVFERGVRRLEREVGPPCRSRSRTRLKTSVLEPESHGGNPSQGSQEGGGLVRIAWERIMPAVSWRTNSKWARLDGAARGEAPPHPGERSGSCGCRDVCKPRVCSGGDGLGVGGEQVTTGAVVTSVV